jgi:hypothetical protein
MEGTVRKLTLSVDESVLREARRAAKRRGSSISAMVSRFFRVMARKDAAPTQISPTVRKLSGIVSLPKDKSDRELLEDALVERYGLDK